MYELQKRHVDYTANLFLSREAWLTRGSTCRHSRYLLLIIPPHNLPFCKKLYIYMKLKKNNIILWQTCHSRFLEKFILNAFLIMLIIKFQIYLNSFYWQDISSKPILTKKNIIYFKIIKIYNNNSFNVKVRLKHFICKMKKQQNFPLNLTSAFYQSPFSLTSKLTTDRLLSHPFKTLAHVPPTEYPRPILISIRCTYNLLQFSGLRFVKRLMDTSVYSFDAGLTDVSYTNGRQRAWRSRG